MWNVWMWTVNGWEKLHMDGSGNSIAESSAQVKLIQCCFLNGFSNKEITMFLPDHHDINISLTQLHRLLHQQIFTGDTIKTQ